MSKHTFEGEIILPQIPQEIAVKVLGQTIQVPVHQLTKEQKDELAKRWREGLDAVKVQAYRTSDYRWR